MTDRATVTVTFEGYDVEQWERSAISQIVDKLREKVDQAVLSAVKAYLQDRIQAVSESKVCDLVESVLTTAVPITNQYGDQTGKTFSVREEVMKLITKKTSPGYGMERGPDKTFVEREMENILRTQVDTELKKVFEETKAAFKKELDSKLTSVVTEALKKSLGH